METVAKRIVKRTVTTPSRDKAIVKKRRPIPKLKGRELVEDPFNLK